MKAGDWVIDEHGNVGCIRRSALPNDFKNEAVEVGWHAFLSVWEVPRPFVKRKYLTVVTKEVADIIRSSKP